jgi:hypothetical protein
MSRIAFIILVLIGGACAASGRDAKVGGTSIDLVMPTGFCELSESNSVDARMLTSIGKLLSSGGNQLLAFGADCQQLDGWRVGRGLLDDYVQYQTRANLADKPLPIAPAEFIKQVCAVSRAQGEKLPSGMESDVTSRIEAVFSQIKINETRSLGVLAEDSTACYGGLLQKFRTETGADKAQVAVYATTVAKGRVVYYYLFALYSGSESVRAKQKVGAFLAANQN